MKSDSGWTARALAQRLDIPPATLNSWISNDLVTLDARGKGRKGHVIGLTGLLEVSTIIELRAAGFTTKQIRRAVKNLRELGGPNRPLARLSLLVSGKDLVRKNAADLDGLTISALATPGQRPMVFPMGEIQERLLARLL